MKVIPMIPRLLTAESLKLASWFPVVSVTGPRQSGKSTLVRNAFKSYEYVNLEEPNIRRIASEDPVGFIRNRTNRLIIDEAQYVPDLFSMVQVVSDENNEVGQYILSGSQNFQLLKHITQSLAGRVGILRLLPLSYAESQESAHPPTTDEFMVKGGYPRLYEVDMDTDVFFDAYMSTYIERDVSGFLDVRDLTSFRKLLALCAHNAGNLLNYSNLAKDAGVSFRTVKSWLSILESSYITFELMPWHSNIGKRLTKASKLYFHDTGLLCNLLGIHTVEQLLTHPLLGAIFENLIVAETTKKYFNQGKRPELFFYRDDSKREIDLLDFTDPHHRRLIEIKSSQTYHGKYGTTITAIGRALDIPSEDRMVVYRGAEGFSKDAFRVIPAQSYLVE
jgi:predicted AAA+ superfamily ATPase